MTHCSHLAEQKLRNAFEKSTGSMSSWLNLLCVHRYGVDCVKILAKAPSLLIKLAESIGVSDLRVFAWITVVKPLAEAAGVKLTEIPDEAVLSLLSGDDDRFFLAVCSETFGSSNKTTNPAVRVIRSSSIL